MKDPWRERRLQAIVADGRRDHSEFLASGRGSRLSGFFEILDGSRSPELVSKDRVVHQRMYVPGLTAQPYWPASAFPLHRLLQDRFPLIREEARALLTSSEALNHLPGESHWGQQSIDGGRLDGLWRAYYLQRYFARDNRTAAYTPVALRSLDGFRVSREALFSVIGPYTHIKLHSDELNFVTTLYLPLVTSAGAWIEFAGWRQEWVAGQCFAADSTFLHHSFNGADVFRAILIVDLWHPELIAPEIDILEECMPRIDRVMRGWGRPLL